MTILETKDAMEDLQQVFSEFKSANDERLEQIEKRSTADPLSTVKVEKLNNELDRLQSRFDGLQASLKRSPVELETATQEISEEKSAFNGFIRKGDEGFTQKSLNATVDAEGGYMVPQYLSEEIVRYTKALTPVRELANVITIGTEAIDILVDADEAASAWVAETDARAESSGAKC